MTPHVHDLACKKYEHGGGPIRQQPGSSSVRMPAGMLGKQVRVAVAQIRSCSAAVRSCSTHAPFLVCLNAYLPAVGNGCCTLGNS